MNKENKSAKDLFNFNFLKVQKYCYSLKSFEERISYLEYARREYLHSDIVSEFNEALFDSKIDNEISYLKGLETFGKELAEHINRMEIRSNQKNDKDMKAQGTKAKHRIEWKLGQTDLIEFFELLYNNNLISKNTYGNMNVVIRDCFTDETGKEFDNQIIARSKNQKAKKSKNFFKLEKTIQDFNKKKSST